MSRPVPEWIAERDGQSIPRRVMLRVYEKHNGACPKCGRKLQPGHWACDHITALINGGEHRESNLQPLCNVPCHSEKTAADVAEKSRTYRKRKANLGVRKPRTIRAWRRFDGTIVHAERER